MADDPDNNLLKISLPMHVLDREVPGWREGQATFPFLGDQWMITYWNEERPTVIVTPGVTVVGSLEGPTVTFVAQRLLPITSEPTTPDAKLIAGWEKVLRDLPPDLGTDNRVALLLTAVIRDVLKILARQKVPSGQAPEGWGERR